MLFVPKRAVNAYITADYWGSFTYIIGIDEDLGDVDGDGSVNISDVTALIDILLSGETAPQSADCNSDSSVNISDVTALIDYLLSGTWN